MEFLIAIILGMSKEELRAYKLYAGRTGSAERKDFQFVDYVRKHPKRYEDKQAQQFLYPEKGNSAGAFQQLKLRVLSDVSRCIALQHIDGEEKSEELYYYLLAEVFFQQKQADAAAYYLKKAEKAAQKVEAFEVLDLIYSKYIRLSTDILNQNPAAYIQLRQENLKKVNLISDIENLLASIRFRIKNSLNQSVDWLEIQELEANLLSYSHAGEEYLSRRIAILLYQAQSSILLQKKNYTEMEKYLKETFSTFKKYKFFDKESHNTKLQMLVYLANTLYTNKKYEESLTFVEELMSSMKQFEGMLYAQYEPFYYHIQVNIYEHSNPKKAIEILLDRKANYTPRQPEIIPIITNLAVLYWKEKAYEKGVKTLTQIIDTPAFKATDTSLALQLEIFELMYWSELRREDLCLSRVKEIRKKYQNIQNEAPIHFAFLDLIQAYYTEQNLAETLLIFEKKQPELTVKASFLDYSDWILRKIK